MINLPTTPAFAPAATPPSGTALVLTYLHTDIGADPTPGQGNDVIYIIGNAACTARVGTFEVAINPATDGEQDTPLSPGLGIPSGTRSALPTGRRCGSRWRFRLHGAIQRGNRGTATPAAKPAPAVVFCRPPDPQNVSVRAVAMPARRAA